METTYWHSGEQLTEEEARKRFVGRGLAAGHDPDELAALWEARLGSEEVRDTIFEISGYHLEIELDD